MPKPGGFLTAAEKTKVREHVHGVPGSKRILDPLTEQAGNWTVCDMLVSPQSLSGAPSGIVHVMLISEAGTIIYVDAHMIGIV